MNLKRNRSSSKLPLTALAFYIKLYCERKGSSKSRYQNNLIEATKSYLSLTESEKQKFSKKFEECKEKDKALFFEQLKNAKPYMKIKKASLKNTDNTIKDAENKENEKYLPDCSPERRTSVIPPLEMVDALLNGNNNVAIERANSEVPTIIEFEENQTIREADLENAETIPQAFLIEPIPPTIKTGHQLFYLLNSADDNGSTSWTSLPQFEKNRYSRAVSLLKKDYISKYKEYLESLSPKELFDFYHKTIV